MEGHNDKRKLQCPYKHEYGVDAGEFKDCARCQLLDACKEELSGIILKIMEPEKINYEEDIRIDEQALDVECLEQASKTLKYTRDQAWCEKERDRLKTALALTEAELDNKIRSNPDNYGLEKVTDKAVASIIQSQQAFKDANEKYQNAAYEYKIALGAVSALQDRKNMLEALVKLHGQNYFAGPATPHDLTQERKFKEEKDKKMQERIATRIKRTT